MSRLRRTLYVGSYFDRQKCQYGIAGIYLSRDVAMCDVVAQYLPRLRAASHSMTPSLSERAIREAVRGGRCDEAAELLNQDFAVHVDVEGHEVTLTPGPTQAKGIFY